MKFDGEPVWVEVPDDRQLQKDGCQNTRNGGNFLFCLENMLKPIIKQVQMCFVLIGNDKHHEPIKRGLDKMGVVSQFMLFKNISKKVGVMGVISNLLRQVNAKRGLDLYRMNVTQQVRNNNTMFVGLDVVNEGAKSVIGMTASYSPAIMQYFSDVQRQELRKDQIGKGLTKSEQEEIVCTERTEIFSQFLKRAFKIYMTNNNGKRPE